MAKAKKAVKVKKATMAKTQAERFLEVAKKAKVGKSGPNFSEAMGRITMARNARKSSRMG